MAQVRPAASRPARADEPVRLNANENPYGLPPWGRLALGKPETMRAFVDACRAEQTD